MVPNGKKAAKKLYNVDNGWVAHHNTDLWRQCGPIDFSPTGMWPMGGAWLCLHFWDHYEFTRNLDDLRKHYPVMKESVEFYLDFLQPDPNHGGALVTIPSYSPEQGGLCASPTMDTGILTALFKATIESSKLLNDDPEFRTKMEETMKKFPPFTIGAWGQLREWQDDHPDDNPNNKHRHVSHLFTVFPGNVIRASDTDLFNAAKVSLNARGDDATGWSMGWKINLWARLLDGDRAWRLVSNLIHPNKTYNNLFDAHPPFQIDGNFGGAAGMIEILLQSQETTADGKTIIDILPCLPKALPQGNVAGLKARGNATVAISWQGGKLTKAVISGLTGIPLAARYNGKLVDLTGKKDAVELTADSFK
jgi:alpha-L-fucosidase 2